MIKGHRMYTGYHRWCIVLFLWIVKAAGPASDMQSLLLLPVHHHLPHTLRQRLAPGLGEPAAQQPSAITGIIGGNLVSNPWRLPETEESEDEELLAGRHLPQHHHEGGHDGAHPGQGRGQAQRGVADGRGEDLTGDYVHHLVKQHVMF